jgi:hypothetical protein
MQARLTSRALTLRDIFSTRMFLLIPKQVIFVLFDIAQPISFLIRGVALGA